MVCTHSATINEDAVATNTNANFQGCNLEMGESASTSRPGAYTLPGHQADAYDASTVNL